MAEDPDLLELQQLFAHLGNQMTHLDDCQQAIGDTKGRIARLRIRMNERQQRAQEGARNAQVPTPLHPQSNGSPSTASGEFIDA